MAVQFGQTLGQRLEQRISQAQIQSLDMLAMPNAELRERINEELRDNPALELKDSIRTSAPAPQKPEHPSTEQYRSPTKELMSYRTGDAAAEASDSFQSFLENIPEQYNKGLQAHLLEQLQLQHLDSLTAAFAERIIGNLNGDGFHAVPISGLFAHDLNPATAVKDTALVRRTIHHALSVVRRLEPIGCATKDVPQSLIVQIKILFEKELRSQPVYAHTIDILEHHFAYLEKAHPSSLARAINNNHSVDYKLSKEEAEQILSIIASLNPFPGRSFSGNTSPADYIIPTAFVDQTDTEFTVRMNDLEIPLLNISAQFQDVGLHTQDADAQRYIKDHIHKAQAFIGSLNHRERTIAAVVREIVLVQEAFFLTGDKQQLVPLTQQEIAASLNIHESTVSRTVAGKYLQCKWGIFEMRFFFTNSVAGQRQSSASEEKKSATKEGVKDCIRELLAANSGAGGKFSDQKISDLLQEQYGISVARRTVAKYRKELAIGSSYARANNRT